MKSAIINTTIVMPDHLIPDASIVMEDGVITAFGTDIDTEGMVTYDALGDYTGPGLIDVHTHAADHIRFHNDPYAPAEYLLKRGVTDLLCATSYHRDRETLIEDVKRIKAAMASGKAENIIGIYMEGPYLNVNYGAMRQNHPWAATVAKENFKALVDEAIDVAKVWCIAPERENIEEYVNYIKEKNPSAIFSVAHSEATPQAVEKFMPLGLKNVTHHTNATGTLQKFAGCRTPCIDETALYNDRLYTELICDRMGIHVDPYVLRLTKKIKGDDRIILISDSTDANGEMPSDPRFKGATDINFDSHGDISGTRFTLSDACRNMMVHTGASMCQVFKYASTNPAEMLGLTDRGTVKVGNRANLCTVDHKFSVKDVYLGGNKVK